MNDKIKMQDIVNYCKQYGIIFQGSEIYGGLANTWDYGPIGSRIKNNVKEAWRKRFIQEKENSYEVDADILMHPKVWEASGHLSSFSDPLIDCKNCKTRHRVDNLIDDYDKNAHADSMTEEQMMNYIKENKVPCPKCGKSDYTELREFNLMFETYRGVVKDSKNVVYLRPENAQGEYVNYLNVQRTMRAKLPFSIGQIGKAFRNEITPGNFTFRTIEFEQMEFQTFCKEGQDSEIYNFYKEYGLIIVIIFTVLTSGIVVDEVNKGTIKQLLVTPNKRYKILLSKYLTGIIIILFLILITFLMQLLIGGTMLSFRSLRIPFVYYDFNLKHVVTMNIFKYFIILTLYKMPMFIILNTVLLFLNVFTNNKVITTILVIVLYASNTMSIALSNDFNALVYYIGTHFDLSIYRFGMIIENTDLNLLLSSFVVIAYFIVLIVPTFVIFNKKDIKNT